MKIEDLVLSIEQMNRLKELGLEVKDTAMCWAKPNEHTKWDGTTYGDSSGFHILQRGLCIDYLFSEIIPTLTLQEILEMLPKGMIRYNKEDTTAWLDKNGREVEFFVHKDKFDGTINPLDGAYKMLLMMAEDGYLKQK